MDLIQRAIELGFILKNKENYLCDIQKWLRDTYEIQMIIKPFYDSLATPRCSFTCDVIEIARTGHVIKSQRYNTYEEALEEGLQNGMKLIETKKTGNIL